MIDTSALLAVLFSEPEAEDFARLMADAPILLISAASQLEACLVAEGSRFGSAGDAVESLCQ
ncbi:MAG: type II toxin-antitoxin system VapC family toxin, partial [Cyanobium sp.]